MEKEICDRCRKECVLNYRVHIADGYIEVCSKDCAKKEVYDSWELLIEEI